MKREIEGKFSDLYSLMEKKKAQLLDQCNIFG